MNEMMKQCCGEDGKPDLEKMKGFMEACGKAQFSDDEMTMMKEFCGQEGPPDFAGMKKFMERCGCVFPASTK